MSDERNQGVFEKIIKYMPPEIRSKICKICSEIGSEIRSGNIFSNNKKRENYTNENEFKKENVRKEIKDLLNKIEKDLKEKSLNYFIFINIVNYDLSYEEKKELHNKYKKVYSKPFIDWTPFNNYLDYIDIVDEELKKIVGNSEDLKESFENRIMGESEKKAKEILENIKSKQS